MAPIKLAAGFLFLLATLFFAAPPDAHAVNPSIVNISISQNGNLLTIDALLADGLNDSLLEAIDSGVPITINYEIEFLRDQALWRDSVITANTISHTVQYDSLQKVYRFSSTGKNIKQKIITKERDRSHQLMLTLKDIPVVSIHKLSPTEKYYVRAKASLQTDRFWFPLNHLLFFVPFNDYNTAWTESSPLQIPESEFAENPQSGAGDAGDARVKKNVIRSFNQ